MFTSTHVCVKANIYLLHTCVPITHTGLHALPLARPPFRCWPNTVQTFQPELLLKTGSSVSPVMLGDSTSVASEEVRCQPVYPKARMERGHAHHHPLLHDYYYYRHQTINKQNMNK